MREKDLLALKETINKTKTELSELTGRKNYLFQELKTAWNCDSLKDAENLLSEMKENLKHLEAQIEIESTDLEEELQGLED